MKAAHTIVLKEKQLHTDWWQWQRTGDSWEFMFVADAHRRFLDKDVVIRDHTGQCLVRGRMESVEDNPILWDNPQHLIKPTPTSIFAHEVKAQAERLVADLEWGQRKLFGVAKEAVKEVKQAVGVKHEDKPRDFEADVLGKIHRKNWTFTPKGSQPSEGDWLRVAAEGREFVGKVVNKWNRLPDGLPAFVLRFDTPLETREG